MKKITIYFQWISTLTIRPLTTIFAGLKVEGTQFLNTSQGPVIFITNHRGMFDPWLLASSLPFKNLKNLFPFRFATSIKFLNNPLLRPFLLMYGCFPVAPKSGTIEEVLKPSMDVFNDRKQSMLFFPEGKVVYPGMKAKARPGIAYLARESGWLVIPVGLSGAGKLNPLQFFTFRRKITVRIGQPFFYHEIAGKDEELIPVAEKMMKRVYKLMDEAPEPVKKPAYTHT